MWRQCQGGVSLLLEVDHQVSEGLIVGRRKQHQHFMDCFSLSHHVEISVKIAHNEYQCSAETSKFFRETTGSLVYFRLQMKGMSNNISLKVIHLFMSCLIPERV